jgi:uncharacterized protein with PQ loop repeat
MSLADVAVVVATLLSWVSLLPQIVKLARGRDAAGVSATWPAIGLVSNATWTAYLLARSLWAAAPSTAVMVLFYVLVLRYLRLSGTPLRRPLARGAAWALVLAATGVAGGWEVLGFVLGWSYAVQLSPSVWSAYRTVRPTGVSPGTWALITVEALLWGVYGRWNGDGAIVVYAAVGAAAGVLILARYAVARRRLATAPA